MPRNATLPVHPLTKIEHSALDRFARGTKAKRREARRRADADSADLIALAINFTKAGRFDYNGITLDASRNVFVAEMREAAGDMLTQAAYLAGEKRPTDYHADLWRELGMESVFGLHNHRLVNARWLLYSAGLELLRTQQLRNLRRCDVCAHWFLAHDDRCRVCPDDPRCRQARRDPAKPTAAARMKAIRTIKREQRARRRAIAALRVTA